VGIALRVLPQQRLLCQQRFFQARDWNMMLVEGEKMLKNIAASLP
jgi:hypothetical protein